ncbi:BMP family protein [Hoeflea sp. WL0058]|uniref:BMP family protein n=1 Tax=Flavimaribacter sediminis TaxID=2865987 RepID=A0AAE2ZQ16_9HYPH|nr:BMP family protein [Flavimaribacter sediminis]MBW8639914.1 BMP family protein [Flavimaribacter sediminis]
MLNIDRRLFSRLAIALAATTALSMPALAADKLKVALLVPGLANDGSFNQVAREAMEKLAEEGKVEFELREQQADPATSEPVIRQYASRGYDLIIGHGIELSEPILTVASSFPDIHFAASGGMDLADRLIANVDGWTYDFAQLGYLNGFIASKLNDVSVIGMVGGPELPFLVASHEGFKAALKEAGSDAELIEVYTGSFDDAQKSAEVTRGMIAQGAKVIWTSGDGIGNGVAAAASQGDAYTLGVSGDAGGLAKSVNIASVDLDMYPTYTAYIDDINAGSFGDKFFISGIGNGGLVATPINDVGDIVPDDLGKEVSDLVSALASGEKTLPQF